MRKASGDGPNSAKHPSNCNDDTTSNSSSIPLSTTVINDAMFTHQPINANGRTLIHRHGLVNGMPVQSQ